MNFKLTVVVLLTVFVTSRLLGQSETYFLQTKVVGQPETYSVKKALFSSSKYDEFSPVIYKNGLVFCTNRPYTKIINYSSEQDKGFLKINYIDSIKYNTEPIAHLFSKNLKTKFNDGPVTFNSKGDTIYYSRNIIIDGKKSELSSVKNKLGIFYAIFDGNDWTKIRELRVNNEWYNVTTPWLSQDGKRLYFASDKPGGYGGSDLYYCTLVDNFWDDPVNLGPVINTIGNESYPFINSAGEFFFSSDGHPGHGGKDIFYSRLSDTAWFPPVCLDTPVNSQFDDFGIFTDTLMTEGYFSSKRDKSIDIFHFTTNFPQLFYTSIQKDNNYCFRFNARGSIVVDTVNLLYKWSFGDGRSTFGTIVSHCFPGPGNYNVRLDIVDRETGKLFFTKLVYNLDVQDCIQPYITSPDFAVKGDTVKFDGLKSFLPGFEILTYNWDFGDKNRSKGEKVVHSFSEKGEYLVNLELVIKSESTSKISKAGISKKLMIFNNIQESTSFLAKSFSEEKNVDDLRETDNAHITTQYSAEKEFQKDAVFCIELMSSKSKVDINSPVFRNIPDLYIIKEKLNPIDSSYSYIVDQQMNLMATYPAFRKMISLGFKNVQIKVFVLKDPAEKELHNLIMINGAYADSYFDRSDRLTANAFIMLDQMVKLLNKYPSLKLEIAVHTDNTEPASISLAISQKHAQQLVDFLINRGISSKRLVAKGFGESKPIASNYVEKDRKLNRRIDFIILNK